MDVAISSIKAGYGQNAGIEQFGKLAWAAYASNHTTDGDKALTIALKMMQALPANDDRTKAYSLARILAARERWKEAFDIASSVKGFAKPEPYWADLILVAFDTSKPKSIKTIAGLVVARLKTAPPSSVEAGAKVAMALAEAKAFPEAKTVLEVTRKSAPDASMYTMQFDLAEADVDMWSGDAASAATLLGKYENLHPHGFDTSTDNYYWNLTQAYAAAGDEVNALAMANKATASRTVAMLDVIGCIAAAGQPTIANAECQKIRGDLGLTAVSRLAGGWAQAKDTKGLKAWIDGLDTPLKKMIAEMGVVEGLLHVHLRDPFDSPTWRSDLI